MWMDMTHCTSLRNDTLAFVSLLSTQWERFVISWLFDRKEDWQSQEQMMVVRGGMEHSAQATHSVIKAVTRSMFNSQEIKREP